MKRTLFGYGLRTFQDLGLRGELVPGQEESFASSDMGYVRILVESGVIGLFAFIVWFGYILLCLYKKIRLTEGYQRDIFVASFSAISIFLFCMLAVNSFGWKVESLLMIIVSLGLSSSVNETDLVGNSNLVSIHKSD